MVGKEWMEIAKQSEFMQGSFRRHQWREALLICLTQLTQGFVPKPTDTILEEMKELTAGTTQTRGSPVSAKQLLRLMSDRNMVPMAVKPHSIFFLTSEQNFVAACFDWIISSVSETREMKLEPGDITRLYRSICRLKEDDWSRWDLSPNMRDILKLSRKLREDRRDWKAEAHGNRNRNRNPEENPVAPECQKCVHMDHKERCIQVHKVHEVTSNNALQTKMVIPDEDDVLTPPSKGVPNIAERYVPISKLNLEHISFKKEIYRHCEQLVIHLMDDRTQEEVGGVMFNLLAEEEIERLAENQANIKNFSRKIKRRKAMSDWGHGDMRAIGSRQPAGGRPGDGYAPYPESTVLSQGDIHTLFAYASDIECILAKIEPHAPSVVKEMKAIGQEACVLGSYGITGYHCWNYIAPQHLDKDGTWTISYQLFKKGCLPDEFNFCFSHFGKVLDTVENCVWWFKGDHMHGTVAPRASTLRKGQCLSQGIGITIPHRTLDMARKYFQARWSWKDLCDHWKVDL
ncbi:hypothetical protein L210DRAFT_989912 [Boletus edulis BED1]|uniref:Uncharacterized protein n=1 Tax=Boletus edulis BED1 TaxID=1328754 RepID=A0AAD4B9Z3_BOLED|nr:hypothetical protein L210DRAFT_989912 [Boletus edulis BED1]